MVANGTKKPTMGLAGPKNRVKLSRDPNNNEWTRDTSRFGHKILAAQGWKPGDHLGAKNASHSSHYTAANLSHIRVTLKDDTLGLGAPRPCEKAENFGLGNFGDILSRLNGKSEEQIEEDMKQRRDMALKTYQTERWGRMVFVSGGLLVGDRIVKKERTGRRKDPGTSEAGNADDKTRLNATPTVSTIKKEPTSKRKRKDEPDSSHDSETISKRQKKQKKKDDRTESSMNIDRSHEDAETDREHRHKGQAETSTDGEDDATDAADGTEESSSADAKTERQLRKKERKRLKEEKRLLKEEKRARKAAKKLLQSSKCTDESPGTSNPASSTSSAPTSAMPSPFPPASGTSTPNSGFSFASGRHAARHRYIQAKKLASQDPKALREILMIKTKA